MAGKGNLNDLTLTDFGEFLNNDDVRTHYALGKVLGNGTYGVVRQGTNKTTGVGVAIKIINKRNNSLSQKMLDNEKAILQKVRHPNIISLEALYETPTYLFFVMELVTGGELFDHLMQKGSFSEQEASRIIRSILEGIRYLHSLGIVHRDLKPQNILCELDAKGQIASVKITDFGLSRIMMGATLQSCVGSPLYVAPELLLAEGYGEKVDIWSVGCILYNLLSGLYPFFAEENNALFRAILTEELQLPDPEWTCISDAAKRLVRALLDRNVNRRPTAEQALQHEWLSPKQTLVPNKSITGIGDKLKSLVSTMEMQTPKVGPKPAPAPTGGEVHNQLYMLNGQALRWDDESILSILAAHAEKEVIPKDTVLVHEGEKIQYFYIAKTGTVRMEKKHDGKNLTLLTYTAPCAFGTSSLLSHSPISNDTKTTGCEVEVLKIAAPKLNSLLESNHSFSAQFWKRAALDAAQLLIDSKTRIDSVISSQVEGAPRTKSFIVPGEKEVFLGEFACKWTRKIEKFGTLYVLPSSLLATATFFSIKTKVVIPFVDIISISSKKATLYLVVNKESSKKKGKTQEKITLAFAEDRFEQAKELITSLWTDFQSKPPSETSNTITTTQTNDEEEVPGTLTSQDWSELQKLAEHKVFKRNSVIIQEGESSEKLYYIVEGRCKVVQVRPEDDAEVTIGYIRSRETFGEVGFVTLNKATASVVTDSEATAVTVINGQHVQHLLDTKPGFAGRFYKYLAAIITTRLERRITQTIHSNKSLPRQKPKDPELSFTSLVDALKQRKPVAVIKQLVEKGLPVTAADGSESSPLHVAASDSSYLDIVAFLIQKKANVNAKDANGWTPLHAAANVGNLAICKLLLEQGADPSIPTEEGNLPLHYIVKCHYKASEIPLCLEIVDLMRAKVNINHLTSNGETPLFYCILGKSLEVVQYLLAHGADPNVTNKRGHKPLDIAKMMKQEKLVEILLNAGAGANNNNNTPTSSFSSTPGTPPLQRANTPPSPIGQAKSAH